MSPGLKNENDQNLIKDGIVLSVSRSGIHSFSKAGEESIRLVKGLGVEGDAHLGEKVQHRSRVAKDPNQPNLRQVHLVHSELFQELKQKGYDIFPGDIGENVTTTGLDLLSLPTGTRLRLGNSAVVQITGLRNPCKQLDDFKAGLMNAVLGRDESGNLVLKAGVMGIVVEGGTVSRGDCIRVELPSGPHKPLEKV